VPLSQWEIARGAGRTPATDDGVEEVDLVVVVSRRDDSVSVGSQLPNQGPS